MNTSAWISALEITAVVIGGVAALWLAEEIRWRFIYRKYTRFPKVGTGVVIVDKRGWFLASKRKGSHGAGEWSLPGGHLEWMENDAACAAREVLEETGLIVKNVTPIAFTNNPWPQWDKHYVTLFYRAEVAGGTLSNPEPHRHEEWAWCDPANPPQPLFGGIQHLINLNLIK